MQYGVWKIEYHEVFTYSGNPVYQHNEDETLIFYGGRGGHQNMSLTTYKHSYLKNIYILYISVARFANRGNFSPFFGNLGNFKPNGEFPGELHENWGISGEFKNY